MEAALKSSFRKHMGLKTVLLEEDLSSFNAQNVTSCDDFVVDDLLDFSNEQTLSEEENPQQQQNHESPSLSPPHNQHEITIPSFNNNTHFDSISNSELSVPTEDVADLEWLSHFVEDSFSEYSTTFPTVTVTESLATKAPEPEKTSLTRPCFSTPVPAKARSKRTRTGVRVWPLNSPVSFNDTSSSSTSPLLTCSVGSTSLDAEEKKAKKRVAAEGARRCSHCGVQKTPQWRTGPLGAKTLCNACGVRFKSGRLLPEYRPACSPTFSSELHSNHHRKVLEMRRKKDLAPGPDTGSPPSISGF
ncbi:hypothetical protein RJT34_30502 [Clitoria ternatea]|uniref:GATA transcription factor n=1 Tax=Clitoria ternatea TaxID=43366 RepID=A0AAN9EUQ3_CLITE